MHKDHRFEFLVPKCESIGDFRVTANHYFSAKPSFDRKLRNGRVVVMPPFENILSRLKHFGSRDKAEPSGPFAFFRRGHTSSFVNWIKHSHEVPLLGLNFLVAYFKRAACLHTIERTISEYLIKAVVDNSDRKVHPHIVK
jgi:hypothetical protein